MEKLIFDFTGLFNRKPSLQEDSKQYVIKSTACVISIAKDVTMPKRLEKSKDGFSFKSDNNRADALLFENAQIKVYNKGNHDLVMITKGNKFFRLVKNEERKNLPFFRATRGGTRVFYQNV